MGGVAGVALTAWATGLADLLSVENLGLLRDWANGFGALAPVVYVVAYAAATVFFLPATPLTLLAGLAFGPLWGSVYAFIGATTGLVLAFLISRYVARGLVRSWVEENERLRRIDEGVERQGWRMLVITRLVPVFPFNAQNYAYGLTRVTFPTYAVVSAICMAPRPRGLRLRGRLAGSRRRESYQDIRLSRDRRRAFRGALLRPFLDTRQATGGLGRLEGPEKRSPHRSHGFQVAPLSMPGSESSAR